MRLDVWYGRIEVESFRGNVTIEVREYEGRAHATMTRAEFSAFVAQCQEVLAALPAEAGEEEPLPEGRES